MSLVIGGCNVCGGDLYWEEEEFGIGHWHCIQGGHQQKELMMENSGKVLTVHPAKVTPTEDRPYTKGPKWQAEQARRKAVKAEELKAKLMLVEVKSQDYWRGYRQAVLDGAPK